MSDQKDQAKEKKKQQEAAENKDDQLETTGHGKSGGNMGAGQSGKEDLGSEKPSDGPGMGSHKPGDASSK